jgi:hypothetical protein
MAVETTFEEGQSDRGYGFLIRVTEDYLMTVEITPWQTVAIWKLDYIEGWEWINGVWTGAVRPGRQTNHIEVEVTEGSSGRSDISVTVNGRTVLVVWGQPSDPSPVGLTLYGHAIEVYFNDFEFEEYEPYGEPLIVEGLQFESG